MYAVPYNVDEGDLVRLARRPHSSSWMVKEGWYFISENRRWDADEREWISKATGLHSICPSAWADDMSDRWWKAFAKAYLGTKSLSRALSDCIGIDDSEELPNAAVDLGEVR